MAKLICIKPRGDMYCTLYKRLYWKILSHCAKCRHRSIPARQYGILNPYRPTVWVHFTGAELYGCNGFAPMTIQYLVKKALSQEK